MLGVSYAYTQFHTSSLSGATVKTLVSCDYCVCKSCSCKSWQGSKERPVLCCAQKQKAVQVVKAFKCRQKRSQVWIPPVASQVRCFLYPSSPWETSEGPGGCLHTRLSPLLYKAGYRSGDRVSRKGGTLWNMYIEADHNHFQCNYTAVYTRPITIGCSWLTMHANSGDRLKSVCTNTLFSIVNIAV